MRFHDLAAVAEEARAITVREFRALHPPLAFIVEECARVPRQPGSDDPTPDETAVTPTAPHTSYALGVDRRVFWVPLPEAAPGQEVALALGRETSCEICLPHPAISRFHATLRRSTAKTWMIDDTSRNGTTIFGRPLRRSARITDGDRIGLAGVVLLRPFFNPSVFYELLRRHALPADSAR